MRRAPAVPKVLPNIVTLERLKSTQCSWPEGEPGEDSFRFCGKLAVPGKPYCAEHCLIAYRRKDNSQKIKKFFKLNTD